MTRGKVRVIAHRRRREGRTDYRQRFRLLKSGKPRLVIRRSKNSISCQIVKHDPNGDKTMVTARPGDLEKFGWKSSKGNLPCAYLTGMLCGIEAKKVGVKSAILDMGLQTSTKASRIYGALKGALDSGLEVPHSPDVLPSIERIRGLHIEEYSKSKGKLAGVSGLFDDVKKRMGSGKVSAKKTAPKTARTSAKKAKATPKKSEKKVKK